jgi:hypothetical protein
MNTNPGAEKMTTTEIAKAFRSDVKAAKKAGKLPKSLKLSVRTEYFSMGSSIDVRVKSAPFALVSADNVLFCAARPNETPDRDLHRYTPEAQDLLETLSGMLNAYNEKDIDSQTDYFNVRFWDHTEIDHDTERNERDAILAGVDLSAVDCDAILNRAHRAAYEKQEAEYAAHVAKTEPEPTPEPTPEAPSLADEFIGWLDTAC